MITEAGRLQEKEMMPEETPNSIVTREKYIAEVDQQMTEIQTISMAMKDYLQKYKKLVELSVKASDEQYAFQLRHEAIEAWSLHLELTRLFFLKVSDLSVDTNCLQMNGHPFGF